MTTTTVPFGAVRAQLRELVSRVAYGGERITITRNGSPAAALVSLDDLRLLEALAEGAPPESADPDESIAIHATLRDVWTALTKPGPRARWWPGFLLDGYPDGDAEIDWDKRRGKVLECVEGETVLMVWGWRAEDTMPRIEVRIDFAVDGEVVTVRIRQEGPGQKPEYWRERLEAWRVHVEAEQDAPARPAA
ncbi:type II toxin-antitoxin system prevent-host-death family antitoxin [Rhodococcus spelaei]|uniref:Antitoxin n=1 Tax=Rhodococcus spelaei TaxID=2546320 RepID=A0A541B126_9NOCA|nr:type II toxin-antitoxin system prevent-host-death family antitoxin [Rhodococcus spelaei]TQF66004.1 type II toxin-antitoxin system prevent-host-death family antitoxin [Rhodococcus spelaei]